jgi:hypothetical protein
MPRVGGRKVARLGPLSSGGKQVEPADLDKSMWRRQGLMRSGIEPARGRGDEGVETRGRPTAVSAVLAVLAVLSDSPVSLNHAIDAH